MAADESTEWIDDYLDGDRSQELLTQLRGHLAANEENVRSFAHRVFLHQQLRDELFSQAAIECLQKTDVASAGPVLRHAGLLWSRADRYASRSSLLLMAMVIGIVGVGTWWLTNRSATPSVARQVEVVAKQSADGKLGDGTPIASASVPGLPTISSMQFGHGTSKLRLDGIGSMLIEGPADFSLVGPMRARMTCGRIKVRVTEKTGHGFVVETPYGEVTDLGTEFGLDLTRHDEAGLVVFEGSVDLRVPSSGVLNGSTVQRLIGGEAVTFREGVAPQRMMAITSGGGAIFTPTKNSSPDRTREPIIVDVSDNLPEGETKKFYEIVPGGLQEDALAFVDREHEWNGKSAKGIPKHLLGADYVKSFNENKLSTEIEVKLAIARPARVFVFFDTRMTPPDWLLRDFRQTRDSIGMDLYRGPRSKLNHRGRGPGISVEIRFNVWERVVSDPTVLVLGPANSGSETKPHSTNYGIAAIPLLTKKKVAAKPISRTKSVTAAEIIAQPENQIDSP